MTLTDVANLALSALGEPLLTDYATDTGTTAQAVRLHLPIARDTILEGHVWSFATACSRLTEVQVVETAATLTTGTEGSNNAILFTAAQSGPSGNEITVAIAAADPDTPETSIAVSGNAIAITPPAVPAEISITGSITIDSAPVTVPTLLFAGTINGRASYTETGIETGSYRIFWDEDNTRWIFQVFENSWEGAEDVASPLDVVGTWDPLEPSGGGNPTLSGTVANTAADIIAAVNAHASASLLVTAADAGESDGTGIVSTVTASALTGGSTTGAVFAPAYGSAFNLPDDCLRVIKIDGTDIDQPLQRWEIQGRHLLLETEDSEAPVIHYITAAPDPSIWPVTFADAVAFLLAHRLAPLLSDDQNLAAGLLNRAEMALAKARSKDTRETRSKENFTPRHLAARSGLVISRFSRSGLPPYAAPGSTSTEAPVTSADLDAAFESEL